MKKVEICGSEENVKKALEFIKQKTGGGGGGGDRPQGGGSKIKVFLLSEIFQLFVIFQCMTMKATRKKF
jgi:hypothetical protein